MVFINMNSKKNIERFFQLINEDSKPAMEKQKLISVAEKLQGILGDFDSPTDVLNHLRKLGTMQSEYLTLFGIKNLCKIIFIIYYKKNGLSNSKIEEIINSIYFTVLFTTEGNDYTESCDTCGGDGYITCGNCDSEGSLECDFCDGSGVVNCDDCDGTGEVEGESCDKCEGSGEVTCDECDGDGHYTCRRCGGDGSESCDDCDGDGGIETDDTEYSLVGLCFWDKEMKNILEIREKEVQPAMEEISDKFWRNSIKLTYTEEHTELDMDKIETDVYYCCLLSEQPEVFKVSRNLNIHISYPEELITFITD